MIAFSEKRAQTPLIVEAYRGGVFPMPLRTGFHALGWWSPMRRGVLPLDSFRVTRSMRQATKRYLTTIDCDFVGVVNGCAHPRRPFGWIDHSIKEAYVELHRAGLAHSVETWDSAGRLVGGLYGVSLGGLFCGESMFHHPEYGRDASKVALMRLIDALSSDECADMRVIDVQWPTPHLTSMGAITIERDEYLALLDELMDIPEINWDSQRIPTEAPRRD